MDLQQCITLPTATKLQHMEKEQRGHSFVGTVQPTPDSASSSSGASPTTPFDHRSFTFSEYENRKQFVTSWSNLPAPSFENHACLETEVVGTMTIDPPVCNYQHQQKSLQKTHRAYGGDSNINTMVSRHTELNNHDLTIMPKETATDSDTDSNSILNKNNTNDSPFFTNHHSNGSSKHILPACDHDDDSTSIGNSSYSVDCTDFPSPPSSTPSLAPRLKIQTNMQQHQEPVETTTTDHLHSHQDDPILSSPKQLTTHSVKKMAMSSRFKEVFDIEGTDLEWDYDIKYRQQTRNLSPIDTLPSKSAFSLVSPTLTNDHHHVNNKQKHRPTHSPSDNVYGSISSGHRKKVSGFINTIGRSTSSSSSSSSSSSPTTTVSKKIAPGAPIRSLSTSSSTNHSIRGLMRSLSTTAANHYRQPKLTLTNTAIEEDEMTKAAQIVAATSTDDDTINTLANDDASLLTATSIDGRRRKISHLLSNAIKKTPTRRHTTKVVNMQQLVADKKLVRRTVIYVNSDESTNDAFMDIMKQYRPHRPAPSPPSQSQPYRYGKRLPPVPAQTTTCSQRSSTSSASRLSSSSSSSFASTPTSSPWAADKRNAPYLEGLELREMEDGSMEWGIIQKKGRRKSFYPMMGQQPAIPDDDNSENEEQIEQSVLALMGLEPDHLEKLALNGPPPPIPRRSPRRKPSMALTTNGVSESGVEDDGSTTDTYYAHDMNLPSLLRLMSQQHDNNLV